MNIIGAAAGELRRHGVRGQQRGHNAGGAFFIEALEHAQHLELGLAVQPVAGLGFQGCGAGAQHPVAMTARGDE